VQEVWAPFMADDEQACLASFVADNEDLERLEALLSKFNIFEAVGAVWQELRHSDFLAFLLDPTQNHGLGDLFLKRFLVHALGKASHPPLSVVDIDVVNLGETIVRREWRNIDILLHAPAQRIVCVIENKVGSQEHTDQLGRYREIIAANSKFADHRMVFIYLTPGGDGPSDDAYVPLSYSEIATLVDSAAQTRTSNVQPEVRTLLTHYATMLRRHIVADSEIADLCQKIYYRHRQALDLIFEHRPDLQSDLAEQLRQLISEAVDEHGLIGPSTAKAKRYVGFADKTWMIWPTQLKALGWQIDEEKAPLLFEFENWPDQLTLMLLIRPIDQIPVSIRQVIHEFVRSRPKVFRCKRDLGANYIQIWRKQFLSKQDLEDATWDPLVTKVTTDWHHFLNHDLPLLRQELKQLVWPQASPTNGGGT
jgi:PD-(D/E)XK nuclease superfamily